MDKTSAKERTTMSKKQRNITNAPVFNGPVTGQIHAGSGDIIIGTIGTASKEELLSALRAFKAELDAARRKGLPEEIGDKVLVEVNAAESETGQNTPSPKRIAEHLQNAKEILVAGTGIASAATTAAAEAHKLLPLIDAAIQTVRGVLGM
jgi:hypothetical protein